jgi:hypothetical protein
VRADISQPLPCLLCANSRHTTSSRRPLSKARTPTALGRRVLQKKGRSTDATRTSPMREHPYLGFLLECYSDIGVG